ncbi:MAG: hypothetical protein WDW38_003037 [Sanguina aurantia]
MAPEVLFCATKATPDEHKRDPESNHYSAGADAWAVGIFAYELIIGVSPFKAKDKADTARNIICAQVEFPQRTSELAMDFILSCLEKHPGDRPTVIEMLQHPWMTTYQRRPSTVRCPCRHLTPCDAIGQQQQQQLFSAPAVSVRGTGVRSQEIRRSSAAHNKSGERTGAAPSLLRALLATYGRPFSLIAVAKLANDALAFSGPLLLQLLVVWITRGPDAGSAASLPDPGSAAVSQDAALQGVGPGVPSGTGHQTGQWHTPGSPVFGYTLALTLGLTSAVKALINAHSGYQLSRLNCRVRAGLMCVLHRKALLAIAGSSVDHHQRQRSSLPAAGSDDSGRSGAHGNAKPARGSTTDPRCRRVASGSKGSGADPRGGYDGASSSSGSAARDTGGSGSSSSSSSSSSTCGQSVALEVQTLMSVDVGRVLNLGPSLNEAWSLPLQVAVALYLLYTQVKFAFVGGLAVSLLLIPINRWIAIRIQAASVDMMTHKDARVRCMLELLHNVRTIKANGWEELWEAKVRHHRQKELRGLAVRKYLDALCVYFWAVTSLLFSSLTFGLAVLMGTPLSLSSTFTSLALFQLLIGPLNALPWVINGVVEAMVSVHRLESYLSLPERKSARSSEACSDTSTVATTNHPGSDVPHQAAAYPADGSTTGMNGSSSSCSGGMPVVDAASFSNAASHSGVDGVLPAGSSCLQQQPRALLLLPPAVLFSQATFNHPGSPVPALRSISLAIPTGGLVVVVGAVGSGKSTLLKAILGELQPTRGSIAFWCERDPPRRVGHHGAAPDPRSAGTPADGRERGRAAGVGFAGQEPWVMAGTLRENVLLGGEMDVQRYNQALHAAALLPDLADLPLGDVTHIGERGATLSGGQRARLSLARALYAHAAVYVIDDVLSSLDSASAAHVVQHGLLGPPMQGATRIVVTHSARCIEAAHLVVELCEGRITFSGSSAGYAARGQQHPTQLTSATSHGHDQAGASAAEVVAPAVIEDGPPAVPPAPDVLKTSTAREAAATSGPAEEAWAGSSSSSSDSSSSGNDRAPCHTPPPEATVDASDTGGGMTAGPSERRSSAHSSGNAAAAHARSAGAGVGAGAGRGGVEEGRGVGHVPWPVYRSYFRAIGWGTLALVLLSLAAMQASKMGSDLWVAQQVASDPTPAMHPPLAGLSVGAGGRWLPGLGGSGTSKFGGAGLGGDDLWMSTGEMMGVGSSSNGSGGGGGSSSSSKHSSSRGGSSRGGSNNSKNSSSSSNSRGGSSSGSVGGGSSSNGKHSSSGSSSSRGGSSSGNGGSPGARDGVSGSQNGSLMALERIRLVQQVTARSRNSGDPSSGVARTRQPDIPSTTATPEPSATDALVGRSRRESVFLYGLLLLTAVNGVCTLVRAFSFAFAGMSAARRLHSALLGAVMDAPMSFLGAEPVGRMINRFSSDTSTIDDSLPFILNILLANAVALFGLLAIMCYSCPGLLLLLLPLGCVYRRLQLYYRHTAREVRRLESLALSPVYCAFGEATHAAVSIRAFGAQHHFSRACQTLVRGHQRASLTGAAVSTWLGLRLQLLAAVLVTAVALLATPHTPHTPHSPSPPATAHRVVACSGVPVGCCCCPGSSESRTWDLLAGLVVGLLNGLLTSSAESEQEMVSVERVTEYCDLQPQEETLLSEGRGTATATDPGNNTCVTVIATAPPYTASHHPIPHPPCVPPHGATSPQHASGPERPLPATVSGARDQTLPSPRGPQDLGLDPGLGAGRVRDPTQLQAVLEFRDVRLRYSPGGHFALAGCSFRLMAGQSLGVCGRTGAGKSSLLAAALRLAETESGQILLGGVDTRSVPLRQLRRHFAILPQSAFVFAGSMRSNLDPWGLHPDRELETALRDVRLWPVLLDCVEQWHSSSHLQPPDEKPPHSVIDVLAQPLLQQHRRQQQQQQKQDRGRASVLDVQLAGGCSIGSAGRVQQEGVTGTAKTPGNVSAPQVQLSAGQQQLLCLARLLLQIRSSTREHQARANPLPGRGSPERHGVPGRFNNLHQARRTRDRDPPIRHHRHTHPNTAGGALQTGSERERGVCKVVLLDEITAHVDPATARVMREVLHRVLEIGSPGVPGELLAGGGYGRSAVTSERGVGVRHVCASPADRSEDAAWGGREGGGRLAVLQVAHNLSAIAEYDQVLVMSGGVVVEAGCPRELMNSGGQFSQLAELARC